MDQPTCETCVYWSGADENGFGDCRKGLPSIVPLDRLIGQEATYAGLIVIDVTHWPSVEFNCWCGEHPDFTAWIKSQQSKRVTRDEIVDVEPA